MTDIEQAIRQAASECGGSVSVAVRDVHGARPLGVDEGAVISCASVIKVPMLVEAMRRVKEGSLSLESEFALTAEQRVPGSGVTRWLHDGLVLTLEDLLKLMIIVSDNTATNIVIDVLGFDSVNSTLDSLGLHCTRLQRKMYDWESIEKGRDNVCSAAEMAGLLACIGRGEVLGAEWDARMIGILRAQQDSGKLGLLLPDEVRLATKSGGREGFLHDCGLVISDDLSYSIAVMTSGARSPGEAILAIANISKLVWDWQTPDA